ncbi:DUF3024 domain-containing protein [Pelovirga terrestris]|uniref:DUF3024 domain-containing protein n=1 Tax=Pelovirga terrestris TaxID=2771352 RepID=A0A8J6QQT0_9BACT|nr:DUF3024 domain-containing protein [Pelovirga terrestris]MBD1400045.1 DUF3024 domain-containing protein [Pelovirga terrestris]
MALFDKGSTMSELPEFLHKSALRKLDDFCRSAGQRPINPRRLDYRIAGLQVHLFEVRMGTGKTTTTHERPMAQLRFNPELNQWSLHHQNGSHWQLYLGVGPTLELDKLLTAINQDPLRFFRHD